MRRSCDCETVALTDLETGVGRLPAFRYPPTQDALMLWILEASAQYLESPDFDRDTVFVSPDTLVARDLRPYFDADLVVLVRTPKKYRNRPILNAVQFWPVAAKVRLAGFYRAALAAAVAMPPNVVRWGADSEALRVLLAPLEAGQVRRSGLLVRLREASTVLYSVGGKSHMLLQPGRRIDLGVPVIDFKGLRTQHMAAYFAALGGVA